MGHQRSSEQLSAAPSRDSIGLGTSASPEFSTIELGNPSDTTLARSAAGVMTIEGVEAVTLSRTQTLTNKTLNDFTNDVHANDIHLQARNVSGAQIDKGKVVYISGYNVGNEQPEISLADASSSATMPGIGVTSENIANNAAGEVIVFGEVTGLDTSSFSVGNVLYVSETAGALTATKPTGSALVQEIAEVIKSNASTGKIDVVSEPVPYVTGFAATLLDDGDAATARTTLGLTIGTNVQAWDTQLDSLAALSYAGNANKVVRVNAGATDFELATLAGGGDMLGANNLTDVASAATAFGNIKQAASDTATGVIEIAIQSEMETGTATTLAVVPGRQHFHASAAKFWVYWTGNSTTVLVSYNTTSIADTAVGDADVTIATDFSTANWAGFVCTNETGTDGWDSDSIQSCGFNARAAGTCGVLCGVMIDGATAVGNLTDPDQWQVLGFGDHA